MSVERKFADYLLSHKLRKLLNTSWMFSFYNLFAFHRLKLLCSLIFPCYLISQCWELEYEFLEIFIAFHIDESHFCSIRQTFVVVLSMFANGKVQLQTAVYFHFALICAFCGLYNLYLIYLEIDLEISEFIKGNILTTTLETQVSLKNTPDIGVLC